MIAEQVVECVFGPGQRFKDLVEALPVLVNEVPQAHTQIEFPLVEVRDGFSEIADGLTVVTRVHRVPVGVLRIGNQADADGRPAVCSQQKRCGRGQPMRERRPLGPADRSRSQITFGGGGQKPRS